MENAQVPSVKAVPAAPAVRATAAPASMAGAARVPQGGTGPSMKQQSIFGSDGGRMGNQVPMAGAPQPQLQPPAEPALQQEPAHASMGDSGDRREIVFARPAMGQASTQSQTNSAPAAPLEPYPQIDRVLQTQSVGVSLSKMEVTAILDSLNTTLARITAPENSNSSCVKNLGPGAVEKATTLKNKMTVYAASNPTEPFTDFTADELAGADKILACAGELAPPGASSTGMLLGLAIVAAAGIGTYFLIEGGKKGK